MTSSDFVERFAPFSRGTLAEPYAFYSALRKEAPVWQDPATGIFIVSKAADVRYVAMHPQIFSSGTREALRARMAALQAVEVLYAEHGWARPGTLGHSDPPLHSRYRRLVVPWFSPGRMRAVAGHVEHVAVDLLDSLLEGDGEQMDFHADFSVPLPIRVFAGQLGVPDTELYLFQRFGDAGIAAIDLDVRPDRMLELACIGVEQQHYFADKISQFRAEPADLLISDLANARDEEDKPFSMEELLSIIDILVLGGNETTTNALSLAMWQLCTTPGMEGKLRGNEAAIERFVEECLRYLSPVQFINRLTTLDCELGGVTVPAGSRVMMGFGSANRDEAVFSDADRFDIDRENLSRHLAFGIGIKHCIGAPLARTELRIAWRHLLGKLQGFALDPHDFAPQMVPHPIARGPAALPIRFTRRA